MMKRLTVLQLDALKQTLSRNHPYQALQAELLDHLAATIEAQMDDGQPYELALQQAMQEANSEALAQLKRTYQQTLGLVPALPLPRRLSNQRYGNRQSTSKQLPIWLGASVFTFVALMTCMMWVSQRFSVPLDVFKLVWASGLISFSAVFSTQLMFRLRSRTMRPREI